ncbi:dinucleotide-utilizing protein, partial [Micrococcus luteus]
LRTGPAPGVLRADRVTGRTRRVRVRPRPGCACDPDALGWAF